MGVRRSGVNARRRSRDSSSGGRFFFFLRPILLPAVHDIGFCTHAIRHNTSTPMVRADDHRVSIDLPTLAGAFRQATGTRTELPVRFLYELKLNPDQSINDVAGRLGIPSRTANRWLRWYREAGS